MHSDANVVFGFLTIDYSARFFDFWVAKWLLFGWILRSCNIFSIRPATTRNRARNARKVPVSRVSLFPFKFR
jgi:hypothetical protein